MKIIKNIIKGINSNRVFRNFFRLSWNANYDITFHDVASSFDEAVNKINKSKNFKNLSDTNKIANNDIKHIENFQIDKNDSHAFVPLLISITNNQLGRSIKSILDVGGGVNPISYYIKKYCNIEIPSCVIETEYYAKKLNEITKNKVNYIEYFSNIDDLNLKNFDLVYFGSSLQYFQGNEYAILKKILSYNPQLVIIAKNFFIFEEEDFFSLQSLYRYHLIPHKFFSYKKMMNFFNNEEYKLIFEFNHFNNYKHKKMNSNDFKYKTLVFLNKKVN